MPESNTTQCLIDQLRQRDAAGRRKYGTTLDRGDLTVEQWAQHMLEELLDGAGYLVALQRTASEQAVLLEASHVRILELEARVAELEAAYSQACDQHRRLSAA